MELTRRMALAAAVGALAAAGCTSPEAKQQQAGGAPGGGGGGGTASEAVGASQLTKVLKAGTLRIAILPDFPPWSVQKSDGTWEGYEVEIANDLAKAMGVKAELVATDGKGRLPLLQTDRADVNVSSWTATNERAKTVGYTIPYDAHGAGVLFPKAKPLTAYDQLKDKSVAVARGSTNDALVTNDYPNAKINRFDSIADAIAAVKAGKVDACVETSYTVAQEAKKDPNLGFLANPPLKPSLICMGVRQGDHVFVNYLDNYIRNLNASGKNNELHKKWLGGEPLADIVGIFPK